MEFRTPVNIQKPPFSIEPMEQILMVGSCFADHIGQRFKDDCFHATGNPFGVMYNPVSILHTVERCNEAPRVAFFTLGTNHVYRLKETGEIVDNCEKRPQRLFQEEELSISGCCEALQRAVDLLTSRRADVQVVLTVSPIRYAKYGYHGSQLSKAVLLLAANELVKNNANVHYFPAYEIVNDELRDYRFYTPDMLHPTEQTVDYIWQRLSETYFSDATHRFLSEWHPIKAVLAHKPFHPDSQEYRALMDKTMLKVAALYKKYPTFVFKNHTDNE